MRRSAKARRRLAKRFDKLMRLMEYWLGDKRHRQVKSRLREAIRIYRVLYPDDWGTA